MMSARDRLLTTLWLLALIGIALLIDALAIVQRARADDDRHAWLLQQPAPATKSAARRTARTPPEQCLSAALKDALARLRGACAGVVVVSTFRRNAIVAGSGGSPSLHAACRAVDVRLRDYACGYAVLGDWPGGLSRDPQRVKHLHVDTGRRVRFVHVRRHRSARR